MALTPQKISARTTAMVATNVAADDRIPFLDKSAENTAAGDAYIVPQVLADTMMLQEITSQSSLLSAPSSGKVKLFPYTEAGIARPAFRRSSGPTRRLQPRLSEFNTVFWLPVQAGIVTTGNGIAFATTGTVAAGGRVTATLAQRLQRIEYSATASASAVAGFRAGTGSWGWDMGMSDGWTQFLRWSPLTGVIATQRLCAGMSSTASHTDVEPSSLTNCAFFAADSADTNLQFMHNDASGTCTKIDTGIPVPAADRDAVYDSIIHCDPSGTTLKFKITNLVTGTSYESETGTTNLPAAAAWMAPYGYSSVGGVSNVTGISFHGCVIETHGV